MNTGYQSLIKSPLGPVMIEGTDKGITSKQFSNNNSSESSKKESVSTKAAAKQLTEYFNNKRKDFDLPFDFSGSTEFFISVWNRLLAIPYGETCSYLDIAKSINKPKAVRAVGLANGKNPIAIIVPCHRVIGSNGKLTGHAGGLHLKRWLLDFEKETKAGDQIALF